MAILAIDQGTTGSTCILFDERGAVIAKAYRALTQIYPEAGWVEHDAEEIWLGVVDGVRELLSVAGVSVTAIGITNQRETTLLWHRATGRPVHNAIVWQCRRTSELCRRYEADRERIAEKTGLPLDPYFSATKIRWILENVEGLNPDKLLFGTIDSWLVWKLTGGRVHSTDFTNASRTLLFNIRDMEWDRELLDLFAVPESMLPEVKSPMDDFGRVSAIAELKGVPIAAVAGDQQAALFGQCCFEEGSVKNTYGTGCFMMMNTGRQFYRSKHGLLTTLAIDRNGAACYALEGSVFIGGAVMQWLRDELKLIGHAGESEAMAMQAGGNGGVYLVPAFVGLGAPHWQPDVRGVITGLTRGANSNHIVRAALESIAYQSFDVFRAMVADSGIQPQSLTVDGGAASNGFLMQFQADLLRVPVHKPAMIESTALGTAFLAGLGSALWASARELIALQGVASVYTPEMASAARDELLAGWRKALRQAMTS